MNRDNHGGRRPGAGRPVGSENKATVEVKELLENQKCNPIQGMARIAMNDTKALGLPEGETIPITLRARMFEALAPFVAPKRRSTELTIDQGEQRVVMQLSPDLMKKLYAARGEDMPTELKQQLEELDNVKTAS